MRVQSLNTPAMTTKNTNQINRNFSGKIPTISSSGHIASYEDAYIKASKTYFRNTRDAEDSLIGMLSSIMRTLRAKNEKISKDAMLVIDSLLNGRDRLENRINYNCKWLKDYDKNNVLVFDENKNPLVYASSFLFTKGLCFNKPKSLEHEPISTCIEFGINRNKNLVIERRGETFEFGNLGNLKEHESFDPNASIDNPSYSEKEFYNEDGSKNKFRTFLFNITGI